MKYAPKYFRDTMPEWKRKKDSVVARVIHRPVSFIFSSIFAELGMTPNQVSFISLLVAISACGCFLGGSLKWYVIGAVLVNIWSIIDSADGNMARSIGAKPYGDFIDATSSYFMVGFMLPSMGWAVYISGGFLIERENGFIILIGAFAGLFDTMSRLFFQKMKCNSYEIFFQSNNVEKNFSTRKGKIAKLQTIVESELGLGGWNMIFIFLCVFTNSMDIYILFYFLYYGAVFIFSTVYLIKKTKCLQK